MEWSLALIAAASAARSAPLSSELRHAQEWVAQAFLDKEAGPADGPGLSVERQEWGTFRLNRSVTDAPLKIGPRRFTRGIGTHAKSEIHVRLPAPSKTFEAVIGVDNCPFTSGGRGSAAFPAAVRFRDPPVLPGW